LDQRLVRGRGRLRPGAGELERRPRLPRPVGREVRLVVVRPAGDRDAPVGHRAVRGEGGRVLKRPDRLVGVEREQERESLIELLLRGGAGGADFAVVAAEALEQRRGVGRRRRRGGRGDQQADGRGGGQGGSHGVSGDTWGGEHPRVRRAGTYHVN